MKEEERTIVDIGNIKHLIGFKNNDPSIQEELKKLPYVIEALPNGDIGICIDGVQLFTPDQLVTMLFKPLKERIETLLNQTLRNCF